MGQAPKPFTLAEQRTLVKLHAQGLSLGKIATQMKRGRATISRYAKNLNLSFDREVMAAATVAAQFDRKAARAKIIEGLYKRSQHNLDRMNDSEFDTLIKSGPGEESPGVLEFVPTIDEKNLTASIGIALTSAAKLEAIDDDGGLSEARGLLSGFFAAVAETAEPMPEGMGE